MPAEKNAAAVALGKARWENVSPEARAEEMSRLARKRTDRMTAAEKKAWAEKLVAARRKKAGKRKNPKKSLRRKSNSGND